MTLPILGNFTFISLFKKRQTAPARPKKYVSFYGVLIPYFRENYGLQLSPDEVIDIYCVVTEEAASPAQHFTDVWDYFKATYGLQLSYLQVCDISEAVKELQLKKAS